MEQNKIVLCDTNIFIEVYKGNSHIMQTLTLLGLENIAISDVTRAELFFGARNKKELSIIRKDLNQFTSLPITIAISEMAVSFVEKYSLTHKLSLPDALIAATTVIHKTELFTLNVKDFRYIEHINFLKR